MKWVSRHICQSFARTISILEQLSRRSSSRLPGSPFLAQITMAASKAFKLLKRRFQSRAMPLASSSTSGSPSRIQIKTEVLMTIILELMQPFFQCVDDGLDHVFAAQSGQLSTVKIILIPCSWITI